MLVLEVLLALNGHQIPQLLLNGANWIQLTQIANNIHRQWIVSACLFLNNQNAMFWTWKLQFSVTQFV